MTQKEFDAQMIALSAEQAQKVAEYDEQISDCKRQVNLIELQLNDLKGQIIAWNMKKNEVARKRQQIVSEYHQKKHELNLLCPKGSTGE